MPKVDGDVILSAGLDTSGITNAVGRLQKTVSKGLKNAIRIGFGVRSVFMLIRKVRKALLEGIGNLAQMHEPLNQAVSQMMTALNLLKNTFVAAFAPLIEVVAPIITKFLGIMTEAIAKVGQFIAALTGKEYVRAAEVQMNYAESLNKSTSKSKKATNATKEQTKAAKELEKTLAGFDDVEILHEDKDTDTSSTTTEPETPDYSFGTAPVDNAIKGFAEKFKAAWAEADFSDLGRVLGVKIRNALRSIPWDKINNVLKNIATGIATFLNGFIGAPGLFTQVGKTLGTALNSLFLFAETFLDRFNADKKLGKGIRDIIVNAVQTLNTEKFRTVAMLLGSMIGNIVDSALNNPEIWSSILTLLSTRFLLTIEALSAFIKSIHWDTLGINIAQGINSALNSIPWKSFLMLFVNGLNSITVFLFNFFTTFNWQELGTIFRTGLVGALASVHWQDIFNTLYAIGASIAQLLNAALADPTLWSSISITVLSAIISIINGIYGFVSTVDWAGLVQSITTGLNTAFSTFDWFTLTRTLVTIFMAIVDSLDAFTATFDYSTLIDNISQSINQFLQDVDWTKAGAGVAKFVSNLFDAVAQIFATIDWGLVGHSITDAIGGFLTNFDWGTLFKATGAFIATAIELLGAVQLDIWKACAELGRRMIEGGGTGIENALSNIGTWIKEHIFNPFIEGFKAVFQIHSPAKTMEPLGVNILEGLKEGILSSIKTIGSWIDTNVATPICNFFKSVFGIHSPSTVFSSFGSLLMDGLKEGVSGNLKAPETALSNVQTSLQNAFSAVRQITSWKNIGDKLISAGLAIGIKSAEKTAVSAVNGIESNMQQSVSRQSDTWRKLGTGIVSQLQTGISNSANSVVNAVSTVAGSISNSFTKMNWNSVGSNIGQGIYNGLVAQSGWLNNLAWNTAVNMYNAACSALGIASPSKKFAWIGEMLMQGLGNGIVDNGDTALGAVEDVTDAITKEASSANPKLSLDTTMTSWVDALDNVLTAFSDTIIAKFDSLITTLNNLANSSNYSLPAITQGRVVPVSANLPTTSEDSMSKIMTAIDDLADEMITREELSDVLTELFSRYLNIDFYIGDEQIARHANSGNARLSRRYKAIPATD